MSYKLFIDDLRFPVTDDWEVARQSGDAINIVQQNGFPQEISFDHDLGYDDTSIRFLHWIAEALMDGKLTIPEILRIAYILKTQWELKTFILTCSVF